MCTTGRLGRAGGLSRLFGFEGAVGPLRRGSESPESGVTNTNSGEAPVEENPTRICELIVGLGDVEVLATDVAPGGPLALHIRTRSRPACRGCGGAMWSKGASPVGLVDLPVFWRPVRLMWHKWRWRCPGTPSRSPMWPPSWVGIATPRTGRWSPGAKRCWPRIPHG